VCLADKTNLIEEEFRFVS